ncbi:hypothetical protein FA09DRAFT_330445 [Tilletiopsis washingtonensis]|uniref:DUF1748-domain-containing protein n=1 Tax=Tilletiopsis washingtonensis TaxID=58919 RepID=A0A316Z643_9BASI|nr:hypothetical protein FA09DRAFT_330445 [Tilletiopsis washingtonensis]PWN97260.1 hypothetical protein FA09DRAFT_330445 [Tilletiopsis washingtonensis]
MLGKLLHLTFDALLLSMVLSGLRRGSGLAVDLKSLPMDARGIVRGWLESGEWAMDFTTVVLGRSSYFERIR